MTDGERQELLANLLAEPSYPLSYRELLWEKISHTMGQRCRECYEDYLHDTGKRCDLHKKFSEQLSYYCED